MFDIKPPDTTPDVFLVRLVAEDRHRKLETPSNNLTPEGIVLEAIQGRSDAYRRVGILGFVRCHGGLDGGRRILCFPEVGAKMVTII